MLDAGQPPPFTWNAGGTADSSAPLNSFTVTFYDQNWDTISGATGTADSSNGGSISGSTYTWQPQATDQIWKNLVKFVEPDGTLPTTIYLEIEGEGNDGNHPIPSGPYIGDGAAVGTFNPTLKATPLA